jgi:uncharacterized protein (DUF927 family)
MREKVKAQAAKVGVRGFIGLWNAYLETINQQKGISLDNATTFEGQQIELFSGQYICDEYGVSTTDKYGYEQFICRHPIMPIERLVNIDSGEERLRIAYKKGRSWRSIVVEKTVLASSNAILSLAASGILVNSENAKALSTYLLEMEQKNYEEIPEEHSVGRLGWVGEHGFSPYVDGLVFDGENSFKHTFGAVKSNGSFSKWLEMMKELRAKKSPARFFLAASFASAILEPCGLLPFFFHVYGGTEVGKTVGLMVAASVWANPRPGEYITTFNSTDVGMELTASFLNSLPMCIDELQIQSSAGVKDFDKIIYRLTEGVGKIRGAKTGGLQRTAMWRNCFITNGEQPITHSSSGGGAVNRIIEFECTEKLYDDLPFLCGVINENYGFAGEVFSDFLQSDVVGDSVSKLQKEYYRMLLEHDSTEKQAAAASAMLTADAIATQIIFKDDNNLTVDDMATIMTSKSDVDINVRAYEYLIELCSRNINHFRAGHFGEVQCEVWGKIDENKIYIIKSVFDREMTAQGFNPTAFLSWAKKNDVIDTADKRQTCSTRISGNIVRCVCIKTA